MSEFLLLNRVTVMIIVTFWGIGLAFSVYNISKNYLTKHDTHGDGVDIYKISSSGFVSSPMSRLN